MYMYVYTSGLLKQSDSGVLCSGQPTVAPQRVQPGGRRTVTRAQAALALGTTRATVLIRTL